MRLLPAILLCLVATLTLVCPMASYALSEEARLPRNHHRWARFRPGAWSRVRVVTKTFDEKGKVTTTSTTNTTHGLMKVERGGCTLKISRTMEVAGKVLDAKPQEVWRGFNDEKEGETSTWHKSGPGAVVIDGESVPCDVYEVETVTENQRRTTKVYYSAHRAPFVLKREIISTDGTDNPPLVQTVEEVVATDLPFETRSGVLLTSVIKTVRRHVQGTTITTALHCDQVPGGVVSYTSKELDASGRVIRRSTLELIDYGLSPNRRRLLDRDRPRRRSG